MSSLEAGIKGGYKYEGVLILILIAFVRLAIHAPMRERDKMDVHSGEKYMHVLYVVREEHKSE